MLGDVWKNPYFLTSMFLRKTSIYNVFDVSFFRFFKFLQNISYVKKAFENQFPQVKRDKNSYRFPHFLKNIKNKKQNSEHLVGIYF